jgi:PHD/YefM family antitoxin component YafN of YafNO toxin-antitoxin module
MTQQDDIFGMQISHVRAILADICRQVAATGRPLAIRRYRKAEVVVVPIWEWQRLKALEAEMMMTNEKDPGGMPRSEDGRDSDVTR